MYLRILCFMTIGLASGCGSSGSDDPLATVKRAADQACACHPKGGVGTDVEAAKKLVTCTDRALQVYNDWAKAEGKKLQERDKPAEAGRVGDETKQSGKPPDAKFLEELKVHHDRLMACQNLHYGDDK